MSPLMSVIIAVVTSLNVLACAWLIWWTARARPGEVAPGEVGEHVWDSDLRERNNPMPRWWLALFFITIGFCFLYFLLYPALGRFPGLLGWSEARQYRQEMQHAEHQYAPIYAAFAGRSVAELASDPRALALGHSLFETYCINCHGSDARGGPGFPNLTTNDFHYGGDPDSLVQSITHGREGLMPPLGGAIGGEQGVDEVVDYVLSLNGRAEPAEKVAAGKERFTLCATCHGADAKGNHAIGAPDLTADIWQYGGSAATLHKTVMEGRHGTMPAHQWLGEDKVRLLAAYVYSLSHGQ
ncbi:MAG TPA: cytochrome-c oxidase, cbb3-type subunit III [Steroidobacteraceae bacterium]|nr:cytochrome-c oxidase, cbb3-type subunit III [Steroidobacteraceae bacterium]